jgi:hypothetical protein
MCRLVVSAAIMFVLIPRHSDAGRQLHSVHDAAAVMNVILIVTNRGKMPA